MCQVLLYRITTWACELKFCLWMVWQNIWCHAPRERVSWNFVLSLHMRYQDVTLHVSVWVEIKFFHCARFVAWVTLHVSVWVEISLITRLLTPWTSHAPRERVSWNAPKRPIFWDQLRHAPRERVSWNWPPGTDTALSIVTLHVSVWVEMIIAGRFSISVSSRSTWACELKSQKRSKYEYQCRHAPRERVSWNAFNLWSGTVYDVTLHVSVWVEIYTIFWQILSYRSRSTWACELKFGSATQLLDLPRHAPRERVSWNDEESISLKRYGVTLHVSVWV